MQFGLFMMPLHPPHRAFADGYDRDIDQIVLADRLGFREAWVGEHLTERWENAPAPDLLIAKALALTKTVRLGTGVTLLALHDPVYLAHRLAMLDHMWGGCFQWGIGAGGIATELSFLGLDHANPAAVRARSAEVLDVVLKLWASEGPFSYHGKFFDIDTSGIRPREGPRVLHEAQSDAAPAHRGGGEHPQVGLHADGGRAWLDPHVELFAVSGVPRQSLAPRRGWRGESGPAGLEKPVAHREGRPRRANPGGGARACPGRDGAKLRAAPAPQSRRHDPDGVDQARSIHARRGGHRGLLDGARLDRGRPRGMRGEDPRSSTRTAAASARCWRSRRTRTTPGGITRACAC